MPTAKAIDRSHVHLWSRKEKAVYCLDCSLHFTDYIAELEQRLARLEQRALRMLVDTLALP